MNLNKIDVKCLVLDKRYNDWLGLQKQCNEAGFYPVPFVCGDGSNKNLSYNRIDDNELPPRFTHSTTYPTWWARPNAYNAWKAHRAMMEDSVKHNRDLLILEDDAELSSDFNEIFNSKPVQEFYDSNYWDMLYLGWYSNGHLSNTWYDFVYRMNGGAGFHGVILKLDFMKDLIKTNPIGPFDETCGRLQKNNVINAFAIYPAIINQKSGFSYVENSNLEKPDRYHK